MGLGLGLVAALILALSPLSVSTQAQQAAQFPTAEKGPKLDPLPKPRAKTTRRARGGLGIGGAPAADIRDQVKKQNAADRPNLNRNRDTQYFRIAVARPDNSFMALNYFPALPGENPPVILLIHEKDRTSRDFNDKIEGSKEGAGLAAALQAEGFAVVTLDVAGLTDPRRRDTAVKKEIPKPAAGVDARASESAVRDIRLTYQFLVDRHNRLEFNLGKLAILTLGEGADAVLEWLREATAPPPVVPGRPVQPNDPRLKNAGARIAAGGLDSATDRPSDISALLMISPVAEWQNVRTVDRARSLLEGSPLSVLVIGGANDKDTADVLKQLKPIVERGSSRLSKVESIETGLHGARLLRFEPGLLEKLTRFLEQTVEFQKNEWEPRYNLTPVAYRIQEAVSKTMAQSEARKTDDAEKAAPKAKEAPKPKAEEPPKPKAEEKPTVPAEEKPKSD
jgi:hypothetical protein